MKTILFLILITFSIKLTTAQNVSLAWDEIDGSTTNADSEFNTLITDSNNNVYLTGFKASTSFPEECVIMKYDENGIFQWDDSFGYPYVAWKNNINEGKVIKISPNGNIILAANTRRFGDKFEIRSYIPSGSLNWDLISDNIQAANYADGYIADITVLPDNSIALFANLNYSNGQGNTYSMFKISSSGMPGWSGTYSPNSAHDYGTSIEHDTAGVIYISGSVFNFDNGSYDFTTLNIHPNGSNDWIARFNHLTGLKDMAYDMVVDNMQNQFITGISEITTGQNDMSTIMQNVYGTRLWQDIYGGSAGLSDTAIRVLTDNLQNSIVLGTTVEDTLGSILNSITLIKYDVNGNRVWVKKFLGDDNLGGKAKGISIHPWGNVYITGEVESINTGKDIFVACIDPLGNVVWTYTYNGTPGLNDYSNGIVVTNDFKIYVAGSTNTGFNKKHLVFKLDQLVTSTQEELYNYNNTLDISSTYYYAGILNINYNSSLSSGMHLYLYDVTGKQIEFTENRVNKGSGTIKIEADLSSGLYVFQLSNNDVNKTGKFIVVD